MKRKDSERLDFILSQGHVHINLKSDDLPYIRIVVNRKEIDAVMRERKNSKGEK